MDSVLTVHDVAQDLKLSLSTVYRLLKEKQLPAFKIGSEWRFNLESIDCWRADAEQKLAKNI
jgi:excisionase family DNA binding protein